MSSEIPLRCECGLLRGSVRDLSPATCNHIVCMCDDCQAYAHHLGRDGTLDAHGGTELFQVTPSRMQLSDGLEHLACVRLSERGMLRWYAACCKTAIGNTMARSRWPFVGIPVPFVDLEVDRARLDAALGPVGGRFFGKFAPGRCPEGAFNTAPPSALFRLLGRMALNAARGAHRPTPFFDDGGRPVVEPTVLTSQQRAALA